MSKEEENQRNVVLYTVGHSNREIGEFIRLLTNNKIEVIVDVRKLPGSKKYPHFNQDQLSSALGSEGILYLHLKELGGRRKPDKDSLNTIWKNRSFQAYADHMATAEFREGIATLLEHARAKRVAVMCSEAVWWRCHRALIADYLKSIGIGVHHIMGPTSTQLHPYTSAARIRDGQLTYHE